MYSARKPYNKLKLSVKDFFTAPVRHLKDIIMKESVFEKPYWDMEYPEMHLDIPAPDWPDRNPPGGPGGPGGGETPQSRWCLLYCDPTFDCEVDPVEIHSAVFSTFFPPTGEAAITMIETTPGRAAEQSAQQWNDCYLEAWASPGDILSVAPGQWTRIGPSIAVWLNPEVGEHTIYGRMVDGAGNECFCHVSVTCDCCQSESYIAPSVHENTPDTIARGGSITVTVANGCPPYSWATTSDGYSFANAETDGTTNTLSLEDSACHPDNRPAVCVFTITDDCEESVTGRVRATDGKWKVCTASNHAYGTCTDEPSDPALPTSVWDIDDGVDTQWCAHCCNTWGGFQYPYLWYPDNYENCDWNNGPCLRSGAGTCNNDSWDPGVVCSNQNLVWKAPPSGSPKTWATEVLSGTYACEFEYHHLAWFRCNMRKWSC